MFLFLFKWQTNKQCETSKNKQLKIYLKLNEKNKKKENGGNKKSLLIYGAITAVTVIHSICRYYIIN